MAGAEPVEGFLVLERLPRGVVPSGHHHFVLRERPGLAVPGAPLEVLGGVQADAEDPGPQVLDFGDGVPGPPALQERLLGRVLGVVRVAEQVQQGADEFVADPIEHGDQRIVARTAIGPAVPVVGGEGRSRNGNGGFRTRGRPLQSGSRRAWP